METLDEIKSGVDHPAYYGGKDNPYEAVKVLHAWGLDTDVYLWTAGKYLSRAGKKDGNSLLKDLSKARWYLDYKIQLLTEQQKVAEEVVDTLKKMPKEVTDELTKMPDGTPKEGDTRWIGGRGYCIYKGNAWLPVSSAWVHTPQIETAVVPECADEVKF